MWQRAWQRVRGRGCGSLVGSLGDPGPVPTKEVLASEYYFLRTYVHVHVSSVSYMCHAGTRHMDET